MAVPVAVLEVQAVMVVTVVQSVVLAAQVVTEDMEVLLVAVWAAQAVVMGDMEVLPAAAWAVIESFEIRRNRQ